MLPPAYFRSRAFTTANAVVFFQLVSLIGSLFFISQLFQTGLGYRPLGAGVRLLVWTAMPMLVAPLAGALADRFGNKPFMVVGLPCRASVWRGWPRSSPRASATARWSCPLIVAGIGISMCFPTIANAVVGSVRREDAGVAAGANSIPP